MTSIHMTMLGEPYGDQGDQRGCPSQEGGLRLIRFESPRWRPKATQVRVCLGLQDGNGDLDLLSGGGNYRCGRE